MKPVLRLLLAFGVVQAAANAQYYTMSTVAGVDFAAGQTANATALNLRPNRISVDSQGNLYIADIDDGRVWRVTPGGVVNASYSVQFPLSAVADAMGTVYVLALPDLKTATIYKATSADVSQFAQVVPSFLSLGGWGLAIDPSNNLYFADYSRVVKVSPSGVGSTFAVGGGLSPWGAVRWQNGLLYVADFWGCYSGCSTPNHNRISVIDPNGNVSIALDGMGGLGGFDIDKSGVIYLTNDNTIVKVGPGGQPIIVAGDGTRGTGGDGGLATSAQFWSPSDIAIDRSGAIYIADGPFLVRKVVGGIISTVAGGADSTVPATQSPLRSPTAIAVAPSGDLFVVDDSFFTNSSGYYAGFYVRRVMPDGSWSYVPFPFFPSQAYSVAATQSGVYVLFSSGSTWEIARVEGDGSVRIERTLGGLGGMDYVTGLAADAAGNYYVAGFPISEGSYPQPSIWKSAPDDDPEQLMTFGSGTYVVDLCADALGNLYIGEGTRVRKLTPQGTITVVAGTGAGGFSGDYGPAVSAQLSGATSVALDGGGNLYIADTGNRRVRMVTPNGIIRTISQTPSYEQGGPGKLALDSAGNVYCTSLNFRGK